MRAMLKPKRQFFALSALAIVACAGLLALFFRPSGVAGAESKPFSPANAVESMHTLRSSATVFHGSDARLARVSADLAPAALGEVHEIGNGALAWERGAGRVCYLLAQGAGGCFSKFTDPVNLTVVYDNGVSTVVGIVPDAVASITVKTRQGEAFPTAIEGNVFSMTLPSNRESDDIIGHDVVLDDGTAFESDRG